MDAARHLVVNQPSANSNFGQFLFEFFMYHDVLNSLTSLDRRPLLLNENFEFPTFINQPEAGAMLGVIDGLFLVISKITRLRDEIRIQRMQGNPPDVSYQALSDAVAIDADIRDWKPSQPPGTPRFIAAQLYRQCTWLYLYRTMMPSKPSPKISDVVDASLEYLRQLPPDSSSNSILLMPLFLLGCSAFDPEQRPDIQRGFENTLSYSNLGNIRPAWNVVQRVWEMMDAGDEASWDWEVIFKQMGFDFLVT
jgi:hypothetical protein